MGFTGPWPKKALLVKSKQTCLCMLVYLELGKTIGASCLGRITALIFLESTGLAYLLQNILGYQARTSFHLQPRCDEPCKPMGWPTQIPEQEAWRWSWQLYRCKEGNHIKAICSAWTSSIPQEEIALQVYHCPNPRYTITSLKSFSHLSTTKL